MTQPSLLSSAYGTRESVCGSYRYGLWKRVGENEKTLVFILHHPPHSEGAAERIEINSCCRRAERLGFGWACLVNLYALRSASSSELISASDPIGPQNDEWLRNIISRADLVICGWGKDVLNHDRPQQVLRLVRDLGKIPCALRLNTNDTPSHPLRLPLALPPIRMFVP